MPGKPKALSPWIASTGLPVSIAAATCAHADAHDAPGTDVQPFARLPVSIMPRAIERVGAFVDQKIPVAL
jgi:hypothetical protein